MGYTININIDYFKTSSGNYKTWINDDTEEPDDILNVNVLHYKLTKGYDIENELNELIGKFNNKSLKTFYYSHTYESFLFYLAPCTIQLKKFNILQINRVIKNNLYDSIIKNSYIGYALAAYKIFPDEQDKLIVKLLENRNEDGSWNEESVFYGPYKAEAAEKKCFGSKELTTSYVIRFLSKYLESNSNSPDRTDCHRE
jgi:hypothetical protein